MSYNYFQGTLKNPYHISIGAVVKNDKGEICCHYFKELTLKGIGTLTDFYLLMRETIEPNETIEACLKRGLQEEFGIEAYLDSYIGSIVSKFTGPDDQTVIEKTTLYFLCTLESIDITKRKQDDPESHSEIQWIEPSKLIIKMKEQGKRLNREDADESVIVERMVNM